MNIQEMRTTDIASALQTRSNHERSLALELFARLPMYPYNTMLLMPIIKKETETGVVLNYITNYKRLMHRFTGNDVDYMREALKATEYGALTGQALTLQYNNVVFITLDATRTYINSLLQHTRHIPTLFMIPESDKYNRFATDMYEIAHRSSLGAHILIFRGTHLMRCGRDGCRMAKFLRDTTLLTRRMRSVQRHKVNGNAHNDDKIIFTEPPPTPEPEPFGVFEDLPPTGEEPPRQRSLFSNNLRSTTYTTSTSASLDDVLWTDFGESASSDST